MGNRHIGANTMASSILQERSPTAENAPTQENLTRAQTGASAPYQKVEGEIVNDLTRLRAALGSNWDINHKVIGNWYLLLWPPQTLFWWAVDYGKEDALSALLDHAFVRSADNDEDVHVYRNQMRVSLNDALHWARRKGNTRMANALELAITRLDEEEQLSSLSFSQGSFLGEDEVASFPDNHLYTRNARLRTDSTATFESDHARLSQSSIHDVEDILQELRRACEGQSRALSKAERLRVETAMELDIIAAELETKRQVLDEKTRAANQAESSFTEAAEHLEAARVFIMAAEESFLKRREIVERTRKENEALQREVEMLTEKHTILHSKAHRLEEGVASVLVSPIHVIEYVADGSKTSSSKMDHGALDDPLECPVCRDERVSKNLQCGHAFCAGCVKRIHEMASAGGSMMAFSFEDNKVAPRCPMCKAVVESVHPLYLS